MASEDALIKDSQHGDAKAFAALVAPYQNRLFRMIYRFSGNAEDARDILQEVLIHAFQSLPKFKGQSTFYTWLYRITIRTCYKEVNSAQHKMRRLTEPIESDERDELTERAKREFISRQKSARLLLEEKETIERVRSAISTLPKKFFEVVALRDIEGLSYEEVAHALGISIGTVMSRLNRAHRKLLKKLKASEIKR